MLYWVTTVGGSTGTVVTHSDGPTNSGGTMSIVVTTITVAPGVTATHTTSTSSSPKSCKIELNSEWIPCVLRHLSALTTVSASVAARSAVTVRPNIPTGSTPAGPTVAGPAHPTSIV